MASPSHENKVATTRPVPHVVRLPGFIGEHEIGLGDVIKRATATLGIKPCGGCERRAMTLNRWMQFSAPGTTQYQEPRR